MGVSNSEPVVAEEGETVKKFLTRCACPQYAERLFKDGYNSMRIVRQMGKDDFMRCGVTSEHVKVILEELHKEAEPLTATDLGLTGGAPTASPSERGSLDQTDTMATGSVQEDLAAVKLSADDRFNQLFKRVTDSKGHAHQSYGWEFIKATRESYDGIGAGGWQVIAVFEEKDKAYGRSVDEGKLLQIAFRGTCGVEFMEQWLERVGNTNIERVAFQTADDGWWPLNRPTRGDVHLGFFQLHKGLIHAVRTWVKHKAHAMCRRLEITGHSRGAASATLAGAELAICFPAYAIDVVTWASPRVGDAAFCKACRALPNLSVVSFANTYDPVPWLPLEYMGFKHVAEPRLLDLAFSGAFTEEQAASKLIEVGFSGATASLVAGALVVGTATGGVALVGTAALIYHFGEKCKASTADKLEFLASTNPHDWKLYEEAYELYFKDPLFVCQKKGWRLVENAVKTMVHSEVTKSTAALTLKLDNLHNQAQETQTRIDALSSQIEEIPSQLKAIMEEQLSNQLMQQSFQRFKEAAFTLEVTLRCVLRRSEGRDKLEPCIEKVKESAYGLALAAKSHKFNDSGDEPASSYHRIVDYISSMFVVLINVRLQVAPKDDIRERIMDMREQFSFLTEDVRTHFCSFKCLYAKLPKLKEVVRLWDLVQYTTEAPQNFFKDPCLVDDCALLITSAEEGICDEHMSELNGILKFPFRKELVKPEGWRNFNRITELSNWTGYRLKLVNYKTDIKLQVLNKLPESIGVFKALEKLTLVHCSLTELPESTGELQALQLLNLQHTDHLTKLPKGIVKLKALKELILAGSGLTELPESFGELEALQVLNLHGCRMLRKLPKDFNQYMCYSFPRSMVKLKALKELNLTYCSSLTKLPDSLQMLQAVQELKEKGKLEKELEVTTSLSYFCEGERKVADRTEYALLLNRTGVGPPSFQI